MAQSDNSIRFRVGAYHKAILESLGESWGLSAHECCKRLALMAMAGLTIEEYPALIELSRTVALKPIENGHQPFAAAIRAARKHIDIEQRGKRISDLSACIHKLTEKTGTTPQSA